VTIEWAGADAWESWAVNLKVGDQCIAYGTDAVVLSIGEDRCRVLPDRPGADSLWVEWEDLKPVESE